MIKQQFLKNIDKFSILQKVHIDTDFSSQSISASEKEDNKPSWINRIFKMAKMSSLEEELKSYFAEAIFP
jgi:hypothetical protein